MGKKFFVLACLAVVGLALTTVVFAQGESVSTSSEVAKAIAEKMCVGIVPPIDTIPADQQYEVYANALASRGINNFVGKDAAEEFTVGEIKEIYYVVTAGQQADLSEQKAECPAELTGIFNMPADSKLNQGVLNKVLDCFPACDLTAEPFTAPVVPPVPLTPPTIPEEPASEIQ
ncbi:MAG TPA: hypothetical protein DCL35_03100 [Candidatus Omnitrophica bacterium]|nr:hypothetical protein [Candidatus Omnitrophota bacterium]